jgi:ribosomal protein S27E
MTPAHVKPTVAFGPSYQRHQPEKTVLYQTIADNLETFVQTTADQGGHLPWFVRRAFDAYLDCGILAKGFLRLRCGDCGLNQWVAFSCKLRAICPSCGVRRMQEGAAHIVERILPRVPVRQWVLSLPFWLRFRVAYDSVLCGQVLSLFIQAVQRWYRHTAKKIRGLASVKFAHGGSVTCIQRFSSALDLNVHFHALVLDGVYIEEAEDRVRFLATPPPSGADLQQVTEEVARKVATALRVTPEDAGDAPEWTTQEPLLAQCAAASVQGRVATGERRGQRVLRVGSAEPPPSRPLTKPDCAQTEGYNLHAGVRVPAHERGRLAKLVQYILRPPLSEERLEKLSDGRLAYHLKRAWSDGTRYVVLSGLELIEKLVALVPPPRAHQTIYHGVLSSHARLRPLVVPRGRPAEAIVTEQDCCGPSRRYLDWAALLKRVFAIDVLVCKRCGGTMKIIAAITQVKVIQAILRSVGLPLAPPERRPAPPRAYQEDFSW